MSLEAHTASQPAQKNPSRGFLMRAAIVMLLFAVAALSTVAKQGQYFAKPNPARYASLSTKMNVASAPVIVDRGPLKPIASSELPRPVAHVTRMEDMAAPSIERIRLIVSMQHRSPPLSLA